MGNPKAMKVIHSAHYVLVPCNTLWLCVATEDREHGRPKIVLCWRIELWAVRSDCWRIGLWAGRSEPARSGRVRPELGRVKAPSLQAPSLNAPLESGLVRLFKSTIRAAMEAIGGPISSHTLRQHQVPNNHASIAV